MVILGKEEPASTIMSGFDSSDDEGESDLSPFPIAWLSLEGCQQKLGISGLPGCRFKDTWRSLEHDIGCLKAEGVSELFTLCTRGEMKKYRVPGFIQEVNGADVFVHHHPFMDGDVPTMDTLMKTMDELNVCLLNGKKSLLHCYGGLGRACLVAVCLMMHMDQEMEPDAAIEKIRQLRGPSAIQSVKQYNFIHDFRKHMKEYNASEEGLARSLSR